MGVSVVATEKLAALLDAAVVAQARDLGEVPIRGHAKARVYAFE